MRDARSILTAVIAAFALLGIAGCEMQQPADKEQIKMVARAMDQLPEVPSVKPGLKRPFFSTIAIGGRHVTAQGVLDYHSPRDFRITATTEPDGILFDVRFNWAGVTVLRHAGTIEPKVIEAFVVDLSKSFDPPQSLAGMSEKPGQLVLKHRGADTHHYQWLFDSASGQMRQEDVELGAFDNLRIEYRRYNGMGWPEEIAMTRRSQNYSITLSFTDDHIAQRDWHGAGVGNNQ